MTHRSSLFAAGLAMFMTCQLARDASAESREGLATPVRVEISVLPDESVGQFAPIKLEAYVYRPLRAGRHPVVIFNHGSAGGAPRRSLPSASIAGLFVDRGFVVIVPMRRGRGQSEGRSLESEEKNCEPASWRIGLKAAFDDVTAAFDYAATVPYADASRVVIAGASRGGYLSVAYAAEGARRSRIVGVVNLVGGWVAQAEDNCPVDFNTVSYRRFGHETRLPELWVYGDRDPFYLTSSIEEYRTAFERSGGRLRFRLLRTADGRGHDVGAGSDAWTEDLDRYLQERRLR